MHELMILIAKEMPEEILIDKMEEAFNQYRGGQTDEAKKSLALYSHMLALRLGTEGRDSIDVIKEFNNNHQLIRAFDQKS